MCVNWKRHLLSQKSQPQSGKKVHTVRIFWQVSQYPLGHGSAASGKETKICQIEFDKKTTTDGD